MKKTRLGITVGLLGAIIYFMGLFNGYLLVVLLAGYVLLFEENIWLKKNSVKALLLMICFSLVSAVISFIPSLFGIVSNIVSIFSGELYLPFISNIANALHSILNVLETVVFVVLGIKALNQGTIKIPVVDDLIDKYMD